MLRGVCRADLKVRRDAGGLSPRHDSGAKAPLYSCCVGVIAAVWLAACGAQPPASRDARRSGPTASPATASASAAGAEGAPPRGPQRIISLVPAVTEMLYAIGAGPRVVGVSSFDTYPAEAQALPRVGGLVDPDLERIITLRPDLVIVSESHTDLRAQLAGAGLSMFPHALGDLANVTRTIRALGVSTGLEPEADAVARAIDSRLDAVRSRVAGRPRPPTLLVFSRAPGALRDVFVSGGVGFLHDLLELSGGANVFGGIQREGLQATSEMMLSAAPAVIIELRYGRAITAADAERDRAAWSALSAVPAVRSGRVYVLVGDELVVPGPRVADTAERMARLLHPDAFR